MDDVDGAPDKELGGLRQSVGSLLIVCYCCRDYSPSVPTGVIPQGTGPSVCCFTGTSLATSSTHFSAPFSLVAFSLVARCHCPLCLPSATALSGLPFCVTTCNSLHTPVTNQPIESGFSRCLTSGAVRLSLNVSRPSVCLSTPFLLPYLSCSKQAEEPLYDRIWWASGTSPPKCTYLRYSHARNHR
jgi:hypothetical protein